MGNGQSSINEVNGILYKNKRPFTGMIIVKDNYSKNYVNGLLHSTNDAPSEVTPDVEYWHYKGMLHREGDKPAVVTKTAKIWYRMNKKHRENGPAYIDANHKTWYLDDLLVKEELVGVQEQNYRVVPPRNNPPQQARVVNNPPQARVVNNPPLAIKPTVVKKRPEIPDTIEIPDDLQCGVCFQLLHDPVSIESESVYCRECILAWFATTKKNMESNTKVRYTDPCTKKELKNLTVTGIRSIRNRIDEFIEKNTNNKEDSISSASSTSSES